MTSKGRGHASQNLQITWQGHVETQFTAVEVRLKKASTGPQRTSLPGRNGTGIHEEGLWLCEAANVQLAWLRKTL